MAITESSDRKSKSPVQEQVEQSCSKEAGTRPCGLTQLRNNPSSFSDRGTPTRSQHITVHNVEMVKSYKPRRIHIKDNESDNLSDIDDAEVIGYLNNKEEMQYKRILWEALNKQYTNEKKSKRTSEAKKNVPVKKAKTAEKVEVQKRSSRINYDALKSLNEEYDQSSEVAQGTGADSSIYKTDDSLTGNIIPDGSTYDDDHQHITFSEYDETFGNQHYEDYGDEDFDDIF